MKQNYTAKGITLVELLIYMSLLTVLISIMFSVIFYAQRVLTKYGSASVARIYMYEYLHILQQQLYYSAYVDNQSPNSLILYMYDTGHADRLVSIQHYLKEDRIILEYVYANNSLNKQIVLYDSTRFDTLNFITASSSAYADTSFNRGSIRVHIGMHVPYQYELDVIQDVYIPNLQ